MSQSILLWQRRDVGRSFQLNLLMPAIQWRIWISQFWVIESIEAECWIVLFHKDGINKLAEIRDARIKENDASDLLNTLQKVCRQGLLAYELQDGKLKHVIWVTDTRAQSLKSFYDIAIFVTTFKRNAYGMPMEWALPSWLLLLMAPVIPSLLKLEFLMGSHLLSSVGFQATQRVSRPARDFNFVLWFWCCHSIWSCNRAA